MKFRKKPIVLEAEEFNPDEGKWPVSIRARRELPEEIHKRLPSGDFFVWNERAENWQRVTPGDWIIHGISGCRYPCKANVFPLLYEPAEAPIKRVCLLCPRSAETCSLCDACFSRCLRMWGGKLTDYPTMR